MTMPNERTRSLRWGYELLQAIADDPDIDASIKREAASIATDYPSPKIIASLIESKPAGLPPTAVESIAAAAELFNSVRFTRQASLSDVMRDHLRYTLRHFPAASDSRMMGIQSGMFRISDWLLPEDYYDGRCS